MRHRLTLRRRGAAVTAATTAGRLGVAGFRRRLASTPGQVAAELAALAPRPYGDATAVTAFVDGAIRAGHVLDDGDAARSPVPVVTHPDEWTFGALRGAALLILHLLREGLADGVMCTTGSAFDVQLQGMRPVLTAPGAFRPRQNGEGWPGQEAFRRTFLRPLLLTAEHGVPFHPLLRGCPGGIPQATFEQVCRGRRRSRRGSPTDAGPNEPGLGWLGERYPHPDPVDDMAERLEELVRSLGDLPAGRSRTPGRARPGPHDEPAALVEARDRFVLEAFARTRPQTVLDLSATNGRYARAAAERRARGVVFDADHRRAEQLYRSLRRSLCLDDRPPDVVVLVADPTGPGTSRAWPGSDREPLAHRVGPDIVVAVAGALDAGTGVSETTLGLELDPLAEISEVCAATGAAAVLEVSGEAVEVADHALTVVRSQPLRPGRRTLVEVEAAGT